jgi:two-component system OmpR family sensor kinase
MSSIRSRLLITIFSVLMACVGLIAVLTYSSAQEEITEIFDENMQQIALAVSAHDHTDTYFDKNNDKELKGEEEFLIQVWKNEELIYSSHPVIDFGYQETPGFKNVPFRDEIWRYYKYRKDGQHIQVAQSLDERNETILEVVLQFIIPIFVQLPIMLSLVYIMIGRGLKPLKTLSKNVKERSASNLNPIDEGDAPQEVLPLVMSINQLLRRLENSLRLQKQFTADAAHELRTPLTAVQLQLDMLDRADNVEERKTVQEKLRGGVQRSIDLVSKLLLLARHEPEALAAGHEHVDLGQIVQKVFDDLTPLSKNKKQTFVFSNEAETSEVLGHTEHLYTLAENLIQNAILYTPEKGRIEVDLKSDKENVVLSVKDNGPGIPEQERDRVFDRFYRVLGTKKIGSGLGLSIVKNIADSVNAEISIESGIDNQGCGVLVIFSGA